MKFCARCGRSNDDGAVFCAGCGSSLSSPVQPQAAENTTAVALGSAAQTAAAGSNPGTLWLILNIVLFVVSAVFTCCFCFPIISVILSIIGIVFAGIAMGKFNGGFIDISLSNAKIAKILFFIGAGVTLLCVIGYVVLLILGVAIQGLSILPYLNS